MKFDYVIGNPPYQDESNGNKTFTPPQYHLFMDSAYAVSDKVELITPARFLFNAGSTPKNWNQKMLNDEHLKVESYESDASKVFPDTDIKGGVAITYRDATQNFGAIRTFTPYKELNSLLTKISNTNITSLSNIVTNRGVYRFSSKMYKENPNEMNRVTDSRVLSNAFDRFPEFFFSERPNDDHSYIRIFGKSSGKRVYRWLRKDYLAETENLDKYKVLVPKANGSGIFGEVLSNPLVCEKGTGFTETFIAIGAADTRNEAESILKYIKTKFARTMLDVLKITQDNTRPTWRLVPLQDFTDNSDINWSKSIAEIDQQLYKKYRLDNDEIEFIESHVKEMN